MTDSRQFSGAPTALANICGDETPTAAPQRGNESVLLTTADKAINTAAGRARFRTRRRQWIVAAGQVPATVPMWNGRTAWRAGLEIWRACHPEVMQRFHMSARMFRRIMPLLAEYADGATGRNCAVSNQRIARRAGCSTRTVSTARAILAESGYGIEAHRGTGSADTPFHARRVSVWHLISRRPTAVEARFFHLPRSGDTAATFPLGSSSPSEARTASRGDHTHQRRRRAAVCSSPRALHTQRLAGWLASKAIGLGARDGRHIVGQLCTALERSHLDLEAWTGPDLVNALQADMAARKISWPNHIDNPRVFLAGRLQHLPARPTPPTPAPPPPSAPEPRPVLTEIGRTARQRCRELLGAARRRPDLST